MDPAARSPVWLAVMALVVLSELVWRKRTARGYDGGTALTTLGLVAGGIPFAALNAMVLGGLFALAWKAAPIRLPLDDWRTWAAGLG